MNFQFSSLMRSRFEYLFSMSGAELACHGAMRLTATKNPGFPCRISLEDAAIGEDVLLVNYEHLEVETPFRSKYAVYVRPLATQAHPAPNEVPAMLRTRTLSLRAWAGDGMLAGAELVEGTDIERAIAALFQDPQTSFIHAHFAKPGCYAARIDRT